ncbi:MAG: RDD family protein [Candidatus Omnitrophica bacterium]|nr:RDD family protein [Candidatus Omnitrophota bacterium]
MEFIKPGANKRVCAFIIDNIIFDLIGLSVFGLFLVDFDLLFWLFGMVFKDCVGGQSLGKRVVGILVLGSDGNSATAMDTIKRNVLLILPIVPLVEYVVMLRDPENGQRLGDKWAETKVTDLKPESKDINFLWLSAGLVLFMIVVQLSFSQYMLAKHPDVMKKRYGNMVSNSPSVKPPQK